MLSEKWTLFSSQKGTCSTIQVPFCEEKSVQLFRVAFFWSDFLQNPYFSSIMEWNFVFKGPTVYNLAIKTLALENKLMHRSVSVWSKVLKAGILLQTDGCNNLSSSVLTVETCSIFQEGIVLDVKVCQYSM